MPVPVVVNRLKFVNSWLVREDDGLTLIDANIPGTAGRIVAKAQQLGAPITRIVLTHAHPDHVGVPGQAPRAAAARRGAHQRARRPAAQRRREPRPARAEGPQAAGPEDQDAPDPAPHSGRADRKPRGHPLAGPHTGPRRVPRHPRPHPRTAATSSPRTSGWRPPRSPSCRRRCRRLPPGTTRRRSPAPVRCAPSTRRAWRRVTGVSWRRRGQRWTPPSHASPSPRRRPPTRPGRRPRCPGCRRTRRRRRGRRTPCTPRTRRRSALGPAAERSDGGRNLFSLRNVYGTTFRPARCASATKTSAPATRRRVARDDVGPSTARRRPRNVASPRSPAGVARSANVRGPPAA